jgi:hypothetical protein
MNGTRSIRRGFAAAVAITTFAALTACSTEVKPPEQNIGKITRPDGRAPHNPAQKGTGRNNFGDELGNPKLMRKKNLPAGSGTRNRMDFRDHGR